MGERTLIFFEKENKISQFEQTEEPVVPPEGFGSPTKKIGDKVKYTHLPVCINMHQQFDGMTGTVKVVIFCQSDGQTILYGIDLDNPSPTATGFRCEGFCLDVL